MTVNQKTILNRNQILQKIKRIAHEIYENNVQENKLIIAGIYDTGYTFARMLIKEVKEITLLQTHLVKVSLNKKSPLQSDIVLDCDERLLTDCTIILVDDVLNTGRTLAYSLKPFLNIAIKKLETVVLVNRSHPAFPIAADYIGYELSTTIHEHIEVVLEKDRIEVYLT